MPTYKKNLFSQQHFREKNESKDISGLLVTPCSFSKVPTPIESIININDNQVEYFLVRLLTFFSVCACNFKTESRDYCVYPRLHAILKRKSQSLNTFISFFNKRHVQGKKN